MTRTAIITGSTSGIGLGIAEAYAAEGYNVMLNGFGDADEIEATRAELDGKAAGNVGYHGADMTKPDEIADLVAQTEADMGQVDVLVNNAGIQFVSPIEEFPIEK
ncbi:MAG: SDR family NAD(P)-dependent oxidoreductase, partial [Pseudomonadota bacterium]